MLLKKSSTKRLRNTVEAIPSLLAGRILHLISRITGSKNEASSKREEVWLCFSSISYVLVSCYIEGLFNKPDGSNQRNTRFLVLSRAPSDLQPEKLLPKSRDVSVHSFTPGSYLSCLLLFWAISKRSIKGCHITFKLPHLSEYVVGRWIKQLAISDLFYVEYYDDGLLGCLKNPTASSYYPKTISNMWHWDIAGWRPPETLDILKHSSITLKQLALYTKATKRIPQHGDKNIIILEAKYMNYKLLNQMFVNLSSSTFQDRIFYFQHPSFHKRNLAWPSNIKRRLIVNEQCETWLLSNLTDQSHVYSSVTSTVVLACDFVRQKLIKPFKLTLMIEPGQNPKGLEAFYDSDEAADFEEYIKLSYSEIIDITVTNTGVKNTY